MQVAHFLGDERLPKWLKLAVNQLQTMLASSPGVNLHSTHVLATESLSMDLLDALLLQLPLCLTLSHLSMTSHVRAVRSRVHQDEHGPHLEVEVPATLTWEQAEALSGAVQELPDSLQPVTASLRHIEQSSVYRNNYIASDLGDVSVARASDSAEVPPALERIAGATSASLHL